MVLFVLSRGGQVRCSAASPACCPGGPAGVRFARLSARVAEGTRLKGLSFGSMWVGALAIAFVVAFTGAARAQDPPPAHQPPRLEYTTTAGCPDLASCRDELALAHADKFDPASADVVR